MNKPMRLSRMDLRLAYMKLFMKKNKTQAEIDELEALRKLYNACNIT